MNTDRELLELAALAAGLTIVEQKPEYSYPTYHLQVTDGQNQFSWTPLDDNGMAFFLAVKLGIDILRTEFDVEACAGLAEHEIKMDDGTYGRPFATEKLDSDSYAATRLAVLRCAAAIGQSMKEQGK